MAKAQTSTVTLEYQYKATIWNHDALTSVARSLVYGLGDYLGYEIRVDNVTHGVELIATYETIGELGHKIIGQRYGDLRVL